MNVITHRLGLVAQNVILGTVTGSMVGFNLRVLFQRIGATDLVWVLFFLMGPLVGYLSGKERQRIERLNEEKEALKANLDKIHDSLEKSKKKYRLLVEHANDAIFLTSAEGRFLLFNEATCLLSGYRKDQLKGMSMADLKAEVEEGAAHPKGWLDNGHCCYEQKWRNKHGDVVHLEINARWIRFGGHRMILHVGRNINRQKEMDQEERVRTIRGIQEDRVMEMASIQRSLLSRILSPTSGTIEVMQYLMKKYPHESEKLSELLSEWGRARKYFHNLTSKNFRDLKSTPARWDLNEIIQQELIFLDMTKDLSGYIKQTGFDGNLPKVFGFGRDFSIAFGSVIHAALDSMRSSNQRELYISTKLLDDHILVEIRAATAISYKEHLCNQCDPMFKTAGTRTQEDTENVYQVCQLLFESFGAKMDLGYHEKRGTIIRVRVPVVGDGDEEKKEEKRIPDKQPVIV